MEDAWIWVAIVPALVVIFFAIRAWRKSRLKRVQRKEALLQGADPATLDDVPLWGPLMWALAATVALCWGILPYVPGIKHLALFPWFATVLGYGCLVLFARWAGARGLESRHFVTGLGSHLKTLLWLVAGVVLATVYFSLPFGGPETAPASGEAVAEQRVKNACAPDTQGRALCMAANTITLVNRDAASIKALEKQCQAWHELADRVAESPHVQAMPEILKGLQEQAAACDQALAQRRAAHGHKPDGTGAVDIGCGMLKSVAPPDVKEPCKDLE
jgi:hypothetical protein